VEIAQTEEKLTAKGNRKYLQGLCPYCGTKCAKMLGNK
jgi:hypothetical protein